MATASSIPETSLSLYVPTYGPPSSYIISSISTPTLTTPTSLLIRIHACALHVGSVRLAKGDFRFFMPSLFPYRIGHDFSGVISQAGSESGYSPGDEVWGCCPPVSSAGAASEYLLIEAKHVGKKPAIIGHAEAAAILCGGATAKVAFEKVPGGLSGKKVLITAALGGVGAQAALVAKSVFGAEKVIGTVSTGKMEKVGEVLGEGKVDSVVDYTKDKVVEEVGKESVDVVFDTVGSVGSVLGTLKKGGQVVSCCAPCTSRDFEKMLPPPLWLRVLLNWSNWGFKMWYTKVRGAGWFEGVLSCMTPEDLEVLRQWAEEGKTKGIVGKTISLKEENIDEVKAECEMSLQGHGAIGRIVLVMV